MTDEEKLAILEDLLDLSPGTLVAETLLASLDEWDSISIIGYISIVDEHFGRTVSGEDIRAFEIVKDAMDQMRT